MTRPSTRTPPTRPAAGTAAAASQAAQEVAGGYPTAPHDLGDSQAVASLWRAVMQARLPSQWHLIDIEHAANLVRCLHDIVDQHDAMRREGLMLGRGAKMYANPRHTVIDTLNRRAAMLTRLLQLHSVPTLRAGDRAGQKSEAGAAANLVGGLAPPAANFNADDLIARPRLQ